MGVRRYQIIKVNARSFNVIDIYNFAEFVGHFLLTAYRPYDDVAPQEEVKLPVATYLKLNCPLDSVVEFEVDTMSPSPSVHE